MPTTNFWRHISHHLPSRLRTPLHSVPLFVMHERTAVIIKCCKWVSRTLPAFYERKTIRSQTISYRIWYFTWTSLLSVLKTSCIWSLKPRDNISSASSKTNNLMLLVPRTEEAWIRKTSQYRVLRRLTPLLRGTNIIRPRKEKSEHLPTAISSDSRRVSRSIGQVKRREGKGIGEFTHLHHRAGIFCILQFYGEFAPPGRKGPFTLTARSTRTWSWH